MKHLNESLQADIDAIGRIPITVSLLEIICRSTGMGFAAIARVTEDNWIACSVRDEIAFGLKPGSELSIETTICNEIRNTHEPVVINNVAKDELFRNHHTPAMYGFQSYISVPIFRKDGSFFGTLCAIDPKPAKLQTPETIGMFKMFADLISFHLNAIEEMDKSQHKIAEDSKTAVLREQFVAILGHDLRNPVSAISNSAELLTMMSQEKDILRVANIIRNSSNRMKTLIDNMLDFASGRMGGGIPLKVEEDIPVEKILKQVVAEVSVIWPNQHIDTHISMADPLKADSSRITQLFSNLLRNAATYGKQGVPVIVNAFTKQGDFVLSVLNEGDPIPPEAMEHLFKPFFRGQVHKGLQGLGLGLYIASEIAKAHGGCLNVVSDNHTTCFTLTIPL
ncbi:HAMP domain-containing sensor histidine kinase [soil metagenome]